jgi:hypothetical protein
VRQYSLSHSTLRSDVLRRYSLDDLTTTFSEDTLPDGHKHRGRRIVLYDGEGYLDRAFEWWDLERDRFSILPQLPFLKERTDVLTCQSKTRRDLLGFQSHAQPMANNPFLLSPVNYRGLTTVEIAVPLLLFIVNYNAVPLH